MGLGKKIVNLLAYSAGDIFGSPSKLIVKNMPQAIFSKYFIIFIECFRDAICIKKEKIVFTQLNGLLLVFHVRGDT